MIEIIIPNAVNNWKEIREQVLEGLSLYTGPDSCPPNSILEKIVRGELSLISINKKIWIIGYTYWTFHQQKAFYITYGWGCDVIPHLEEMRKFFQDTHGYEKIEFKSNTSAHNRLYNSLLKKYKTTKSLTFEVLL